MENSEPADPEGMKRLGSQLRAAGDLDGAERWFQRAADAGSIGALYNLGLVAKDRGDSETAERRFLRVAEMGDADAMVHVGRFRSDEGDLDAAEHWYRKAAETGNLMGVANVGSILQKKEGTWPVPNPGSCEQRTLAMLVRWVASAIRLKSRAKPKTPKSGTQRSRSRRPILDASPAFTR